MDPLSIFYYWIYVVRPLRDWTSIKGWMMAIVEAIAAGGRRREGELGLEGEKLGFWNKEVHIV